MRKKSFTRTQSVEDFGSNDVGVFGSLKDRKISESLSGTFTSSAETLEENDEDIYWRLKHKESRQTRILDCHYLLSKATIFILFPNYFPI